MSRVYHAAPLKLDTEIELDSVAAHHIGTVLRKKPDDEIRVFNQNGEFAGQIVSIKKKSVRVVLNRAVITAPESGLHTRLIQAITRRDRMDYSIQKATELGVNSIYPVITEHCVVKLDTDRARQRLKHWQGIARHASEQCGRLQIPEIKPVMSYASALTELEQLEHEVRLIFALSASQTLHTAEQTEKQSVTLAIGPVGGFSEHEIQLAQTAGFQGIKLGPRILRAETATVAALTAVQLYWGDLDLDQKMSDL